MPLGDERLNTRSLDLKLDHHVDRISSRDRTYQSPVSSALSLSTFLHSIQLFFHARYFTSLQSRSLPDDDAAEGYTSHVSLDRPTEVDDDDQNAPTQGDPSRISGAQRRKLAREEKKKRRGQNKGRRFQKMRDELDLCWKVAAGETCEFGSEYVQSVLAHVSIYLAEWIQMPVHARCQGVPFGQT